MWIMSRSYDVKKAQNVTEKDTNKTVKIKDIKQNKCLFRLLTLKQFVRSMKLLRFRFLYLLVNNFIVCFIYYIDIIDSHLVIRMRSRNCKRKDLFIFSYKKLYFVLLPVSESRRFYINFTHVIGCILWKFDMWIYMLHGSSIYYKKSLFFFLGISINVQRLQKVHQCCL